MIDLNESELSDFLGIVERGVQAVPECVREILSVCFVAPSGVLSNPIFGFSQFVTVLALLVVLYSFTDIRYRFRIKIAPLPLSSITFFALIAMGLIILVSDVWFSNSWPVPRYLANQAYVQGAIGLLFLALTLTWILFAFLIPPRFSNWNCKKYAFVLYGLILRGSEKEMPVIADELRYSASSLLNACSPIDRKGRQSSSDKGKGSSTRAYAHDILLLIGSRKFCRHIVSSAPQTAQEFFNALSHAQSFRVPLGQFGKNVTTQAIMNKDSILYHEDDGYTSGLIGYVRPFSSALFGNFEVVEGLSKIGDSPLDIDYRLVSDWDAAQLGAYCGAVLITFENYLSGGHWRQHSYALFRAFENIKHSCMDIYKLDDKPLEWRSDVYGRLREIVEFAVRSVELLEKYPQEPYGTRPDKDAPHKQTKDFYDHIADLMFETVFHASLVTSPVDTCWSVQYGTVWGRYFGARSGSAWKIVRRKLMRLLYEEIVEIEKFPNFKSARILGFGLNVMGPEWPTRGAFGKSYRPLHKAMLRWTKRNFVEFWEQHGHIAGSLIMGGITYDRENRRIVKTYARGLSASPEEEYLNLDS